MGKARVCGIALLLMALAVLVVACGGQQSTTTESGGGVSHERAIQNKGSDTLVNLALAWAEAYRELEP